MKNDIIISLKKQGNGGKGGTTVIDEKDRQEQEDFEKAYQQAQEDAETMMQKIGEVLPPLQEGDNRVSEEELRKELTSLYAEGIKRRRKAKEGEDNQELSR